MVQAIMEIETVINQTFLFSIEEKKGVNMTANLVFLSANSIYNIFSTPKLRNSSFLEKEGTLYICNIFPKPN